MKETAIAGKSRRPVESWYVNIGLPLGMTYDRKTGVISGTPRECGSFIFSDHGGPREVNLHMTIVPGRAPNGWAGIPTHSPGYVVSWRAGFRTIKRPPR